MRATGLALLALAGGTPASAACICLTCAFGADQMYRIASTSMLPTLEPGSCETFKTWDRFTDGPNRGDIVVFRRGETGPAFVFRVIGLGGDRVQMRDGVVWVNGDALAQVATGRMVRVDGDGHCPLPGTASGPDCVASELTETLPGGESYRVLDFREGTGDDTAEIEVPPDHLFLLGDNRDNAADSRIGATAGGPGLVPVRSVLAVRALDRDAAE
ncbi:signal peptidase I [Pelagovum pacificum]|uniref:Signal peptidase I n=1 Tax=Pelagovum pacificum TaxID=2588711 RepID=A0A5C5G8Z7_9RHOB|nr:signal peptidase I [Pelagovum pacificum]QQA42103.1 signal peptidase I [Pelagovum pacificum]TNY31191.1 signal peptidase I [Pelagovum pacificum]